MVLTGGNPGRLSFGNCTVMYTPAVPENQITWTCLNLLPFTSPLFEPLDVFFSEHEEVSFRPALSWLKFGMGVEESGIERKRGFEDHEAAVVGTIRSLMDVRLAV